MVEAEVEDVLQAGGDASRLMCSIDWSVTPLGPVGTWSLTLRTMVGFLLRNRFRLLLWWGPKLVRLYNEACRPIFGDKHPRAMRQPARDCWSETWHVVGPVLEAPFRGEPATTSDDLLLLLDRKGFLEETHFEVAYSPVPDEIVGETGMGSVLGACAETTEQVYRERQLRTLRELGARVADAKTAEQVCASAAATLEENAWEVPFTLFYLLDVTGKRAQLAVNVGFGNAPAVAAPAQIDLTLDDPSGAWRLGAVVREQTQVFERIDASRGALPRGRWSASPHTAVGLSLESPGLRHPYGVLICGVSPHRELDDRYRGFFELAAAQMITAIRNARAYEKECKRIERDARRAAGASMDGFELGRRLRDAEHTPGALRLVAITGDGRESDRRRSREAGFDTHLVKPFALDGLSGAVAGYSALARGAEEPGSQ